MGNITAALLAEFLASLDGNRNMRRKELVDERLRGVRTVLDMLKRRREKSCSILWII